MYFWTTTELKTGGIFAFLWGVIDWLVGGIDAPVVSLATLMVMDFITGVCAAYKLKMLSSRTGSQGIAKKVGILVCIIIATMLDNAIGMMLFRGMVITGFAIIEAMSLVENIDRLGYGEVIPDFIRVHLAKIAKEKITKGEKNHEEG